MRIRFVLAAIGALGLVGLLGLLLVITMRPVPAEPCPLDTFAALPKDQQERCIALMGGKPGFVATVEAAQVATAEMRPVEVISTRPRPTRTVTPIGYIPPFASRFGPVSNEGQDWRGTESVWIVGSVQNTAGMHFPFFVWTAEVRCRIGTEAQIEASDEPFEEELPLDEYWDCPNDAGILRITNVTTSTGVVVFETERGQGGTFDLASEQWTLDGQPWLASPAPAAGTAPAGVDLASSPTSVTIPPKLRHAREIDLTELVDGPGLLRGGNSVWLLGSILFEDGSNFSPLLLIARPPQDAAPASLSLIPERFSYDNILDQYGAYWEVPEDFGTITMTTISDVMLTDEQVAGIVSFVTSQGKTGTFDLASEQWTRGGQPWLPAAPPTPQP